MRHEWHTDPDSPVGTALRQAQCIIDVRSPGEFARGAIAGAVNLPLFSNGERAEIGTLYKMLGRQEAVDKGLHLLGDKLGQFVAGFAPYQEQSLLIYCARGGMRSASVVGLLSGLGYRATQLPGGYKAFRNYVLNAFQQTLPARLIVIHGQTGVGKTDLLQRLDNHLDLEDLAQHRSSVFGAINLEPRTQQHFDAHLLAALACLDYGRPVWVEAESRKIGDVMMPDALRTAMRSATPVLVTAPLPVRVARIVTEYGSADPHVRAQWEAALRSLAVSLGGANVGRMIEHVWAGDFEAVVEMLLREHYDPLYRHAMGAYNFALTLDSSDLEAAVTELAAFGRQAAEPSRPREVSATAGG